MLINVKTEQGLIAIFAELRDRIRFASGRVRKISFVAKLLYA